MKKFINFILNLFRVKYRVEIKEDWRTRDKGPYIIKVRNNTNKDIEDVEIFESYKYGQNAIEGIEISFGIKQWTISEFHAWINSGNNVYMRRLSIYYMPDNRSLTEQQVELITLQRTPDGNSITRYINLVIDKNQFQPNIFDGELDYTVTAFGSIKICQVKANSEYSLYFYHGKPTQIVYKKACFWTAKYWKLKFRKL